MQTGQVEKSVLPNGVRVVTETMPGVHSVSIGVWIKAGSRHEREHECGVAHFLEHMLFKGTATRSACDIAMRIDSVGGLLNAFTTKEFTCFYVKVRKAHLGLAVDLLADIYFNSLFSRAEIDKERNVVVQEINMCRDTPDDYIQDLFYQGFYRNHPLGTNILGELETVEGFTRDDIVGFFQREYLVPDRLIIAAAGCLEHASFLDCIGERFQSLSGPSPTPPVVSLQPCRAVGFHERPLEQVHICLGTSGAAQADPQRYPLFLLNAISGGSMSSRLFQEIRENRGLAYSIYSFTTSYEDTGVFGVYLGVVRETVEESLTVVLRELARLRDVCVDAEELGNAKEQLKGNLLLSSESTDSRMSRLAKCEMYHGGYIPLEDVLRNIDAVTPEQIRILAAGMLRDDLFTFTFLGPVRADAVPADTLCIPLPPAS